MHAKTLPPRTTIHSAQTWTQTFLKYASYTWPCDHTTGAARSFCTARRPNGVGCKCPHNTSKNPRRISLSIPSCGDRPPAGAVPTDASTSHSDGVNSHIASVTLHIANPIHPFLALTILNGLRSNFRAKTWRFPGNTPAFWPDAAVGATDTRLCGHIPARLQCKNSQSDNHRILFVIGDRPQASRGEGQSDQDGHIFGQK